MISLPDVIKRALCAPSALRTLLFTSTVTPSNPAATFPGGAPEGLELLHSTTTVAEAEMLAQVLSDAGFHMEYVPSPGAGAFGTTGSNCLYVRTQEYPEAHLFLKEYLSAEPPEPGSNAGKSPPRDEFRI